MMPPYVFLIAHHKIHNILNLLVVVTHARVAIERYLLLQICLWLWLAVIINESSASCRELTS